MIYTDIYCKLSKCIGQIPCSYEHYLAVRKIFLHLQLKPSILVALSGKINNLLCKNLQCL